MLTRKDVSEAILSLVTNKGDYVEVIWAIQEFNLAFDVKPNPSLYTKLVVEEVNEWVEELINNGYSENLLKETVDIIYVLEGLLAANPLEKLDISTDEDYLLNEALYLIKTIIAPMCELLFEDIEILDGFMITHKSNMSKLGPDGKPIRRPEDNKVLKGPNYTPPDLSELILNKETMVRALRISMFDD